MNERTRNNDKEKDTPVGKSFHPIPRSTIGTFTLQISIRHLTIFILQSTATFKKD